MKGYKVKMWAQTKVSFPFYVNVVAENASEAVENAKRVSEDSGIGEYTFSVYKDSVGLDDLPYDTLEGYDSVDVFETSNDYEICVDEVEDFYCLENDGDVEEFELEDEDDKDEGDEE